MEIRDKNKIVYKVYEEVYTALLLGRYCSSIEWYEIYSQVSLWWNVNSANLYKNGGNIQNDRPPEGALTSAII